MSKLELLKKYLNSKNCFKLILGAGNQNCEQITKLASIYSKQGCRFFDIAASKKAFDALREGICDFKNSIICASIALYDDVHIQKYEINEIECKKCSKCKNICPQSAIKNYKIIEDFCTGCAKCANICSAISKKEKKYDFDSSLEEIIKEDIDCIEFHISSQDDEEIIKKWKLINYKFKGALSICISRKYRGDSELIELLKKLKDLSKAPLLMVQADGIALSGDDDSYRTTLQTIATADIIERAKLFDYIIISGGVNSKTKKLLKKFELDISGVAIGSYARKIAFDEKKLKKLSKIYFG